MEINTYYSEIFDFDLLNKFNRIVCDNSDISYWVHCEDDRNRPSWIKCEDTKNIKSVIKSLINSGLTIVSIHQNCEEYEEGNNYPIIFDIDCDDWGCYINLDDIEIRNLQLMTSLFILRDMIRHIFVYDHENHKELTFNSGSKGYHHYVFGSLSKVCAESRMAMGDYITFQKNNALSHIQYNTALSEETLTYIETTRRIMMQSCPTFINNIEHMIDMMQDDFSPDIELNIRLFWPRIDIGVLDPKHNIKVVFSKHGTRSTVKSVMYEEDMNLATYRYDDLIGISSQINYMKMMMEYYLK